MNSRMKTISKGAPRVKVIGRIIFHHEAPLALSLSLSRSLSPSLACRVDPAIFLQPAHGADDALFNRQPRLPAGRLDFFRVEEDERIVTDPAAVAAGVFEFRFQAERRADEADAVVDLHILRR